jgi:hypothetical protein
VGLHDHLLAREQSVCDELAGSDGDLRVSHGCEMGWWDVDESWSERFKLGLDEVRFTRSRNLSAPRSSVPSKAKSWLV